MGGIESGKGIIIHCDSPHSGIKKTYAYLENVFVNLNTLPPSVHSAATFAKGGDRRSILEVSMFHLQFNNSPFQFFRPSLNVTDYM